MEGRRRRSARGRDEAARAQQGAEAGQAQPRYARYPQETGDFPAPLPLQDEPEPAPWQTETGAAQQALPEYPLATAYPRPFLQGGPWVQDLPSRRRQGGQGVVLFFLSLVLLGAMVLFVLAAYQPLGEFRARRAMLEAGTYFEGVSVDGVELGGLTPAQAAQRLSRERTGAGEGLLFQVNIDDLRFTVTDEQIPFQRNSRAQLAAAWALGRQGFVWGIGSDRTPFDIRYEHTRQVAATRPKLTTASTYDKADVRELAAFIAGKVDREPVIAVIASFDFATRAFTVTQDVPGARLDQEALIQQLSAALDRGSRSGTISLRSQTLLPAVTSVELQNSFTQLSSFSTRTTADEKRNTNIMLAARRINGSTVMPGESFSFNGAVGERTAAKGYQMAPAIAGGITFDEIGGGVCQVSSTLFNAAALADMSIVTRWPHAWPSSYIDKGLDATVNWPGVDFVFRNDSLTPVFIVAGYQNRQVSVSLYGMRADPGESIRLETVVTGQTSPPDAPAYQQNPALPPGTQKELKKARTGYTVDTYRVYLQNGQPYRRDKLFTSSYSMVQQLIEYN
ncbi:MAG: VanW family protein [Christensenellales bacterium]